MSHFEAELINRVREIQRLEANINDKDVRKMSFDFDMDVYMTGRRPQIKKVIFNNPATIVLWKDGTKTVVKATKGDRFNKEKGLAFAMLKKIYGPDYYKLIRRYL